VSRLRNNLCFSPRPRSWHPRMRTRGVVSISFITSFLSFVFEIFVVHLTFLRQAKAEGKGELATCRHRAYRE